MQHEKLQCTQDMSDWGNITGTQIWFCIDPTLAAETNIQQSDNIALDLLEFPAQSESCFSTLYF